MGACCSCFGCGDSADPVQVVDNGGGGVTAVDNVEMGHGHEPHGPMAR